MYVHVSLTSSPHLGSMGGGSAASQGSISLWESQWMNTSTLTTVDRLTSTLTTVDSLTSTLTTVDSLTYLDYSR